MPTLKPQHRRLDPDVIEVLRTGTACVGNTMTITGPRLDPKLYARVNKAIELLGGKWKGGKTQAHVFAKSPKEVLAAAVGDGKVLDKKKTFQLFETPMSLARRMVGLAKIKPGHAVLEPSAGRGNIARAIYAAEPGCRLDLVEIDPAHRPLLESVGADSVVTIDFLRLQNGEHFDRIVMNPPFTGGQDIDHVTHAFSILKPGGRLVAIMLGSTFDSTNAKAQAFRRTFAEVHGEGEELPAGTFRESGTDVVTFLVVMDKPVSPAK